MQSLKKIHAWAQMQDPLSIIKISKIYLCMKTKQNNKIVLFLAAILDVILYHGSLINCSQITRSHFESFFAWNNLNLMQ